MRAGSVLLKPIFGHAAGAEGQRSRGDVFPLRSSAPLLLRRPSAPQLCFRVYVAKTVDRLT